MIHEEDILLKLVEECADLQKELLKAKSYGIDNCHPVTKRKNSTAILDEIMDVREAIDNVIKILPHPTIEEMVKEVITWYNNSPLRFRAEFSETRFEDLPIFHASIGEQVRNTFNLWFYYWEPKIVDGVDVSANHPDNLSMRVIEEAWRQVNAS